MHISKIADAEVLDAFSLPEESFVFREGRVQGAKTGRNGNALLVEEAARFKLFTEGKDLVKILKGSGRFKWKRGETQFSEGDCFEAEGVGEYEVNGSEKFIVIRK